MPQIYTIGHSNLEVEEFIDLLEKQNINYLVDVRSHPYSRYVKWANRETLTKRLKDKQIQYLFLGDKLGGRPGLDNKGSSIRGKVDLSHIEKTSDYQEGINKLIDLLSDYRVTIMCAEEDPGRCHRGLLISKTLAEKKIEILHIRKDGSITKNEELREVERNSPKQLELSF